MKSKMLPIHIKNKKSLVHCFVVLDVFLTNNQIPPNFVIT